MKRPAIQRRRGKNHERGVTMILVAVAMVAIIAMAALSIDVITLYLAREEAQRSADAAALSAAKIISVSGLTGDPANAGGNWGKICGPDDGTNGLATRTAKAVAGQDPVGGIVATTINVTYSAGNGGSIASGTSDCTSLSSSAFGVNPMVTVQVIRASLPSFFSRIWGNAGNTISATATAETFNSSNSGSVGNQTTGTITPVQPRCVKPWVVPNQDPLNPRPNGGVYCNQTNPGNPGLCQPLVNLGTSAIMHPGMSTGGAAGNGANGVIGETFWLTPDCTFAAGGCTTRVNPPAANALGSGLPGPSPIEGPPNLFYAPGQVGTPVLGVPSCTSGDPYEEAIEGCDQPSNYSCGVPANGNKVDLSISPNLLTSAGVQCLIHQADTGDITEPTGQDYLNPFNLFGPPATYPYQMLAGTNNPTGLNGSPISISPSIVSLPIYDQGAPATLSPGQNDVTFVGFLQVFINVVDQFGNVNVTVLNVSGCGNGSGLPVGTSQIGNSPVPVRLITPP
jgi:hypothetical protein